MTVATLELPPEMAETMRDLEQITLTGVRMLRQLRQLNSEVSVIAYAENNAPLQAEYLTPEPA